MTPTFHRVSLHQRATAHPWRIIGICLLVVLISIGIRAATQSWQRRQMISAEYEPPPAGMVFVPAGWFWMGSDADDADPDERPLRRVFVPAFYIDQFEVSLRRYSEFKPEHQFPKGMEEYPVTFLLKPDVEAFCQWAGRRLPTAAEWEKAARGTDGRVFPWGNEFATNRANIDPSVSRRIRPGVCLASGDRKTETSLKPGGSFPEGASPYGVQDMAGNVWEWVADEWRDRNWLGLAHGESRGIIRGGGYNYGPLQARASHQGFEGLATTCHDVGFRCAMDAIPKRK